MSKIGGYELTLRTELEFWVLDLENAKIIGWNSALQEFASICRLQSSCILIQITDSYKNSFLMIFLFNPLLSKISEKIWSYLIDEKLPFECLFLELWKTGKKKEEGKRRKLSTWFWMIKKWPDPSLGKKVQGVSTFSVRVWMSSSLLISNLYNMKQE